MMPALSRCEVSCLSPLSCTCALSDDTIESRSDPMQGEALTIEQVKDLTASLLEQADAKTSALVLAMRAQAQLDQQNTLEQMSVLQAKVEEAEAARIKAEAAAKESAAVAAAALQAKVKEAEAARIKAEANAKESAEAAEAARIRAEANAKESAEAPPAAAAAPTTTPEGNDLLFALLTKLNDNLEVAASTRDAGLAAAEHAKMLVAQQPTQTTSPVIDGSAAQDLGSAAPVIGSGGRGARAPVEAVLHTLTERLHADVKRAAGSPLDTRAEVPLPMTVKRQRVACNPDMILLQHRRMTVSNELAHLERERSFRLAREQEAVDKQMQALRDQQLLRDCYFECVCCSCLSRPVLV